MKVYIVSTYHENGAEDVRATLDKDKIRGLIETHQLYGKGEMNIIEDKWKILEEIIGSGETYDGFDVSGEWGGYQVHIVELE